MAYSYRNRIFPYPFTTSLEKLKEIIGTFNIPETYTNLIASHNTGIFDLYSDSQTKRHVSVSDGHHAPQQCLSGVFTFIGGFSLALNFECTSQTTFAIVIGLCEHQIAKLIETIRSCATELTLPMSLALMWLNVMGELRARRVTYRKDAIVRSELDIGTHWSRDEQTIANQLANLDFDDVTRRLTVLGSETAWDVHAIDTQLEMVERFNEIQHNLNESLHDIPPGSTQAFFQRSRYATQLLKGLKGWTLYTQSRVNIQLQTVEASPRNIRCHKDLQNIDVFASISTRQ